MIKIGTKNSNISSRKSWNLIRSLLVVVSLVVVLVADVDVLVAVDVVADVVVDVLTVVLVTVLPVVAAVVVDEPAEEDLLSRASNAVARPIAKRSPMKSRRIARRGEHGQQADGEYLGKRKKIREKRVTRTDFPRRCFRSRSIFPS